jgi:hypothetical protein
MRRLYGQNISKMEILAFQNGNVETRQENPFQTQRFIGATNFHFGNAQDLAQSPPLHSVSTAGKPTTVRRPSIREVELAWMVGPASQAGY